MALASLVLLTTTGDPADVAEQLEPSPRARILVREKDDPNLKSGVPKGDPDCFGVACELRGDDPAVVATKLGIGTVGGIDRARSIALVGTDHIMLPGPGPAVLIYAMRRLPALTLDGFHDYWITTHAEFGRRALAGQGYRQVHADPVRSAELAEALGIAIFDLDGAVVSESTSWDAYWQRRATPQARQTGSEALADEDNFIDHTRSMSMRYTERG
jgi:hypothetical protein